MDVTVTLAYSGSETVTLLGMEEMAPEGWTYKGIVSGASPAVTPTVGDTGTLGFAWITVPSFPVTFTYRLQVPGTTTGLQTISGQILYSLGGDMLKTPMLNTDLQEGASSSEGEPEGATEGEGEGAAPVEGLVLQRVVPSESYSPGGTLVLEVTLRYGDDAAVLALALEETLPTTWSFHSMVSGSMPQFTPVEGDTGTLIFAWSSVPAFPATFRYRVAVPAETTGTQQLTGQATYRQSGPELVSNTATTDIPEGSAATEGETEGAVLEGESEGALEGEGELGAVDGPLVYLRQNSDVEGVVYPHYRFTPGESVYIRVTVRYVGDEGLTALALTETLPEGWVYKGVVDGITPELKPGSGSTGELLFAYFNVRPRTFFVYEAQAPADATGEQLFSGVAQYRKAVQKRRQTRL